MCKKRVFTAKKRALAHLTSFLLKNAFKRREMLVLALVSLIRHSSMRLHLSQCFHCVKTDNVQKRRFYREITRFSPFNIVLLKNAFERREMLVLALISLILHIIQCVCTFPSAFISLKRYCAKNTFLPRKNAFSAFDVVFAEKRV